MRILLLACLTITTPCHAQVGNAVTTHVVGREIVARDFVGPGQFTVSEDGRITVADYGFSAMARPGCKVQISDSGGHVHGFGVALDRTGCGAPGSTSLISIWADFNAVDQPDALAWLKEFPAACEERAPTWATGEWARAIDGLRTATCRSEKPGGAVEITLQAGAGSMEILGGRTGPEVFYRVTLASHRDRLETDMKLFRDFVCSIKVDGIGSSLCPTVKTG